MSTQVLSHSFSSCSSGLVAVEAYGAGCEDHEVSELFAHSANLCLNDTTSVFQCFSACLCGRQTR